MNRIAMLMLVLASLCGSALCQYSAEFSSYYSGKRYDFRIAQEQLVGPPGLMAKPIHRFRLAMPRRSPQFI
jgi:hypothetical protein